MVMVNEPWPGAMMGDTIIEVTDGPGYRRKGSMEKEVADANCARVQQARHLAE